MHAAHAFDPGDLVKQEVLVAVDIGHHHFQQIIGFLPGDQIAQLHLRVAGHLFFEIGKTFRCVAVHADLDHYRQIQPQLAGIQHRFPFHDDAGGLQLLYPAGTGGGGQAHGLGQLLVGEAAIALQGFQNAQVGTVQFCQF